MFFSLLLQNHDWLCDFDCLDQFVFLLESYVVIAMRIALPSS